MHAYIAYAFALSPPGQFSSI